MTYRELMAQITLLSLQEMDSEVTFHDPESGRYHPVKEMKVSDIDPNFPPLVYLEIYNDSLQQLPLDI